MWNILNNTGILVECNTEFFLNKFRTNFNQCLASVVTAKFSRHKGWRSLFISSEWKKKHLPMTNLDSKNASLSRCIFKDVLTIVKINSVAPNMLTKLFYAWSSDKVKGWKAAHAQQPPTKNPLNWMLSLLWWTPPPFFPVNMRHKQKVSLLF